MIIKHNNLTFDLSKPIDISIPLENGKNNPNAFYAPDISFQAVKTDEFVGSTSEGGILNFKNIFINPHGNGTHTECLGHITKNKFTINECLNEFHFLAQLVTIEPEKLENGDFIITEKLISKIIFKENVTALIIRTTPNNLEKKYKKWTNTNHCYIHSNAMKMIKNLGINHFLIDTPSVDREDDGGKLLAHKTFWNLLNSKTEGKKAVEVSEETILSRKNCTITEMIFADNSIKDDLYLLNIQIISLEMDASPSKIVLFEKVK